VIPSLLEKVCEKGLEEVPYSNERSTNTIDEDEFGFAAQAKNIDCYANSIGLSSMISLLLATSELLVIFLKSDEVEDIKSQVSTFCTYAKFDGGGSGKVPIREESLKRPTPMF